MRRAFFVLGLVTACGSPSAPPPPTPPFVASPTPTPPVVAPPLPPPPPPDPAAELALAGVDPVQLCAFIGAHPGTAEAEQASVAVASLRTTAETEFLRVAEERRVAREVRSAIEAAYRRGATDPCDTAISFVVEVAGSDIPGLDATGLAELDSRVRSRVLSDLRGIAGAWPSFGDTGAPTLRLRLALTIVDFMTSESGASYPELGVVPTISVAGEGTASITSELRTVPLGHDFVVQYTRRVDEAQEPTTAEVMGQMLRELIPQAEVQIARTLRIAAPDPVLAALPPTLTLDGSESADGCAGEIVLAARTVTIDPIARTLFADVVNRTYDAQAEGEGLAARGYFADQSGCSGTDVLENWTLLPQGDGTFAGRLDSTWLLPPACEVPCTVRFDLVARPPRARRGH